MASTPSYLGSSEQYDAFPLNHARSVRFELHKVIGGALVPWDITNADNVRLQFVDGLSESATMLEDFILTKDTANLGAGGEQYIVFGSPVVALGVAGSTNYAKVVVEESSVFELVDEAWPIVIYSIGPTS